MKSSSFEQAIQAQFDLNASVQENVTAIRVVKSYVREDYEKEKFSKTYANTFVGNLSFYFYACP